MIKRWIYILDLDARLNERITSAVKRRFPDYDILEMADLQSLQTAAESRRPEIIIISLEDVNNEDAFRFIRHIRSLSSAIKINIIVFATRQRLDTASAVLETMQVEIAPLPLRVPLLIEKIESFTKQIEEEKNREIFLKPGEVLFSEGDPADAVYIIQNGALDIMKKRGTELITFKTISNGELVGELALIDHTARSATVIASTEAHLVKLDVGDIEGYLNNQPYWVKLFFRTLAKRLREANKKILDNSY